METKKILMIAPLSPPITGQALACDELLRYFEKKGAVVNVINLSKKNFSAGIDSISRIKEIFSILAKISRADKDFDMIYFTPSQSIAGNLKDLLIYALLFRYLNKMVVHLHGGAGLKKILSDENILLSQINHLFIQRLAGAIVLGERLTTVYSNFIAANKIHIANNFSSEEFFIEAIDLSVKFSSIERIKILFLSNLLPGKGYIRLLEAFKNIDKKHTGKFELHFAGGFQNEEDHDSFIADIKEQDAVKYHGVVSGIQKKTLLEQSHVFCLPTCYPFEGQPISIIEAYASGCAVLTTDHSGIFDIFTPEINGIEIYANDPGSIERALECLLNDHRQLRKFGVLNARVARQKYRLSKHLSTMSDIFYIL